METQVRDFAIRHGHSFSASAKTVAAAFEIGCFRALVNFYGRSCMVTPMNLQTDGYRYLTSPNGNPANFSFVRLVSKKSGETYDIRQQVRIRASMNRRVAFSPDLLVLRSDTTIGGAIDNDYAGGSRKYFYVDSEQVIAAHECKSMNPFPELLVSFLGMLVTAHDWLEYAHDRRCVAGDGPHLAPTLFVGGAPNMWHARMAKALGETYPINVITGLHAGTWDLSARMDLNLVSVPASSARDSTLDISIISRPRRKFTLEDE